MDEIRAIPSQASVQPSISLGYSAVNMRILSCEIRYGHIRTPCPSMPKLILAQGNSMKKHWQHVILRSQFLQLPLGNEPSMLRQLRGPGLPSQPSPLMLHRSAAEYALPSLMPFMRVKKSMV